MASYNRTDTNSFPLSISNAYFNGKPVLYVANLGVNVTVTMTVKSTGQEIISSRTYLPEYNIKFQLYLAAFDLRTAKKIFTTNTYP